MKTHGPVINTLDKARRMGLKPGSVDHVALYESRECEGFFDCVRVLKSGAMILQRRSALVDGRHKQDLARRRAREDAAQLRVPFKDYSAA